MKKAKIVLFSVAVLLVFVVAQADTISHNGTSVDVDFVTIGSAGNAEDSTGYGKVNYNYRLGQYEVTASQWTTVATAARISEAGAWSGNQPVASASWYEAAQFCNWLTSGNKYTGAYQFNGSGTLTNVNRSAAMDFYGMVYVLPTENEWYKAAYYTGSGYSLYANGTNTAPAKEVDANYGGTNGTYSTPWAVGTGAIEQNGTYDMMGNVWEIIESPLDETWTTMGEARLVKGGSYGSTGDRLVPTERYLFNPSDETDYIGLRVVAIPEPATIPLLAFVSVISLWLRRRFFD
jgi:formylglycine-generating enzyme required for sulfatase activity